MNNMLKQFSFFGSAATLVHSLCIPLKRPVRQGNEIRVKVKTPAICVTDSAGNTYIEIKPNEEWRAYNILGGPLNVIVDFETAAHENEAEVEEWGTDS